MKSFIITYNNDVYRYIAQFDTPVRIDVETVCGVLFLSLSEDYHDKHLDMEITINLDDCPRIVITTEYPEFWEEIIPLTYDLAEKLLLEFFKKEEDILDGDAFVQTISEELSEKARTIYAQFIKERDSV